MTTTPPTLTPAPAPAPRRRSWFARHKVLTTLLAVVALIVVMGAIAGQGGDDSDTATAQSGAAGTGTEAKAKKASGNTGTKKKSAAGIGDPVRDGKFRFTVTKVRSGLTKIGTNPYLEQKAQGQFIVISVKVENIGDEAQMFDASSQKLRDTKGRESDASSEAVTALGDDSAFLNNINPGNTVRGRLVFDIPKSATPASVELHDSPFSGGVSVSLRN